MTQEEKAKAYDEALESAKGIIEQNPLMEYLKKGIEYIFPELKESGNEQIRKKLINYVENWKTYNPNSPFDDYAIYTSDRDECDRILSWLEKQGEQKNKINSCEITFEDVLALECSMKTVKITEGGNELYEMLVPLYNKIHNAYLVEKQGEKKSADKVEPKFKVGDWVVHDMSDGKKVIRQIINMTNKSYVLDGDGFNTFYFNDLENDYHLWTIEDAKDGDVLNANGAIFIYRKHSIAYVYHYCGVNLGDEFVISKNGNEVWNSNFKIYPATKEQRDTLMKAMVNAGYTFDFEKKELKEIESKFKVGDWVVVSTSGGDKVVQIDSVEYFKDGHPSYFTTEGRWFGNKLSGDRIDQYNWTQEI